MTIPFTCTHCGVRTDVDEQYAGQTGPCAACGKPITVPYPTSHDVGAPGPVPTNGSGSNTTLWIILACVGGLFVLLACGGILVALLLPAVQMTREAARRTQCLNNLQQIGLAMHNYHSDYGSFPPAYIADKDGKPMHSWRVLLLPYLEEQALYEQYDFSKPWDSPENTMVSMSMPDVYGCPSEPSAMSKTSYMVITGPGTLFDGDKSVPIKDIQDGTSNTIMVVEVANAAVNWLEPTDLDVNQLTFEINAGVQQEIGSQHPGGAHVLNADSSVHFLTDYIDSETLEALTTIAGGEQVDPDW